MILFKIHAFTNGCNFLTNQLVQAHAKRLVYVTSVTFCFFVPNEANLLFIVNVLAVYTCV